MTRHEGMNAPAPRSVTPEIPQVTLMLGSSGRCRSRSRPRGMGLSLRSGSPSKKLLDLGEGVGERGAKVRGGGSRGGMNGPRPPQRRSCPATAGPGVRWSRRGRSRGSGAH